MEKIEHFEIRTFPRVFGHESCQNTRKKVSICTRLSTTMTIVKNKQNLFRTKFVLLLRKFPQHKRHSKASH